jgi:hypothetical protein
MGYTHYWRFKAPPRAKGAMLKAEKRYKAALKKCAKLVYSYATDYGGVSGFTAHTKAGTYGGLKFNGSRENGHEDFYMLEHFRDALQRGGFCKTDKKPYDVLVVACLCILAHELPELISVDSDGNSAGWSAGAALAGVPVPSSIRKPALRLVRNG